ncbi:MAG: SDR family oxidoreductase [Pseudomonadota bacterium]
MLDQKVIFVSGAASGIGRAAVTLFRAYGALIIATDIDAAGLESLRSDSVFTQVTDIADSMQVETALSSGLDRFGRLNGAFNNAGTEGMGGKMMPMTDYPTQEFERVSRINVGGLWHCLKAQLAHLSAGSAIVNTCSVMGWRGAPGLSAYVASKHAVAGLTRTAALEVAGQKIRVNAVLPGPIETPMLTDRGFKTNPEFRDFAEQSNPMRRLGTAEEVAEAAAWLLSDKSSYVTGHLLAVDGGLGAA